MAYCKILCSSIVAVAFLGLSLSSEDNMNEAKSCTRGFPTKERIRAVINEPRSYRTNTQAIIPSMNFSCNGSIKAWVFGADFGRQGSDSLPATELQIWRKVNGSQLYQKVGSAGISAERNESKFYYYHLDAHLNFEAGDIVGYYQQKATHRFLFEEIGDDSGHLLYYRNSQGNAARNFDINLSDGTNSLTHALLSVITDQQDCGCGFMSIGRIALILSVQKVSIGGRQQITPSMKITCHGMLTKWIIGADWKSSKRKFPQLQIWSETGERIYKMVNRTQVTFGEESSTNIYEFDVFPPILVNPGHILGILLPPESVSKLLLRAEESHQPETFYVSTTSVVDMIDLEQNISSSTYRPFVTVEIVPLNTVPKPSFLEKISHTPDASASMRTLLPKDKERHTHMHHGQGSTVGVGVGVGVGVTAIIIALALLALGAFIYIKKKRKVLVQPAVVANPTVHYVVEGEFESISTKQTFSGTGKDSQQQRSGNKAKSHEYQSLTPPAYCNMVSSTAAPLAMLTVGGEGHYETSWDALETVVDYYVPTTIQRRNYELEEDGSCPYIVAVKGELFVEQETFWSPGFTLGSIYSQLSNRKFREINKQHIEIGGSLGSGEFGMVSKGRWMAVVRGPVVVAIKTLRPTANEDTQVKFLQEAAVIGQFKHPNIVKLHGVVTVEEPMMIVMEFMANGDLKNYLISLITDPDPPEQDQLSQLCLTFCRQIASGMSYLADKAFVHRDLAARNILVSKDKVCKVADFGMSRALNYSDYYVSHGGMIPVKWTAPEAIHYKKYTTASDVWSFGCVMYEIWSVGRKPFEGFTNAEAMEMVTRGYRLQPPPGCPRRIYSMMISCWHPERLDRPSFPPVCQTLAEEANSLLQWREEDSLCHPHASLLGAPLETGASLYPDLQNAYQGRQ